MGNGALYMEDYEKLDDIYDLMQLWANSKISDKEALSSIERILEDKK